jgi:hypothetical protein
MDLPDKPLKLLTESEVSGIYKLGLAYEVLFMGAASEPEFNSGFVVQRIANSPALTKISVKLPYRFFILLAEYNSTLCKPIAKNIGVALPVRIARSGIIQIKAQDIWHLRRSASYTSGIFSPASSGSYERSEYIKRARARPARASKS